MAETKIQWTDHSINPIRYGRGHFCAMVSPGCAHCYSSRLQPRFGNPEFRGAALAPPKDGHWLDETKLKEVLRRKKPTKYFWCDMTDMFGSWVPDEWLDACFAAMALTRQHTHQVLTKRPERMRDYLTTPDRHNRLELAADKLLFGDGHPSFGGKHLLPSLPLSNVWVGVSVENDAYRWRIAELMRVPAAIRFVSAEPLLDRLQLGGVWPWKEAGFATEREVDLFAGTIAIPDCDFQAGPIHWVIIGGESGQHARPCNVSWIRSIVAQCRAADVACFVKQMGSNLHCGAGPGEGWDAGRLRDSKGGDPDEWAEDLRVREFPATALERMPDSVTQ